MKQSAPAEFHENATPRNTLNQLIQGSFFFWEPRAKSRAKTFINGSIIFTKPIRQQGISFLEMNHPDSTAYTEQAIYGWQDCRYIPSDKSCYFKVDDHDVSLHITYFDEGTGNFKLQYSTTGSSEKSIVIAKTNTRQWLKKKVMLADAYLNNQLIEQTGFHLLC